MKAELQQTLIQKYPKIFQDVDKPMTQTCMCWGIECGDGWYNLLDSLCSLIQSRIDYSVEDTQRVKEHNEMVLTARAGDLTLFNRYCEGYEEDYKVQYLESLLKALPVPLFKMREPIHQVVADQVKEKYATLRFYFHGGDNYIEGAVALAESMSGTICEVCGVPGKVCGIGWLSTRCEEHDETV